MWQPEAHWERLPTGMSPTTVGVWRVRDHEAGTVEIVKRLAAPMPGDPGEYSVPDHVGYWRRAAEVADSHLVEATSGLRGPVLTRLEEDAEGITFGYRNVEHADLADTFVARALGRFAASGLGDRAWLARHQFTDRMQRVEHRGGWTTLSRTTVADLADRLWTRRSHFIDALGELPVVPQHGDAVPTNLLGRDQEDVLAIDWSTLGVGPVGSDLGYWSLSSSEDFDTLLDAYVDGLPPGIATRDQACLGAQITAVYTALSCADWALAQAAIGTGALAAKYSHPSVAPYLRALQRHFPQLQGLLFDG